MSVNKKNRSLWGSRSEEQRIYYQRQTIKRLEKENNQLKENLKLEKQISNGIAKDYEILLNQKKELRSWLENKLASDNYNDGVYYGFKACLLKLNKLEGDENEN